MSSNYSIREADLAASAADIAALWAANLAGYDRTGAARKLELGYVANPAGRGIALLLYEAEDPHPKGVQGLHPRIFHFGARLLRVAGLADFVVDRDHRSLGPAIMLVREGTFVSAQRFDLLYGFPNHKAAPVLTRAGLTRLGVMRRYAKPLSSRAKLAERIPDSLARWVAPLADRAIRAMDAMRTLKAGRRLEGFDTQWDDPVFDEIWASRPQDLLLSERSSRMLRWRFGEPGRHGWKVSVARDRRGVARGYFVWRIAGTMAEAGDFFCVDQDVWMLPLMLAFSRAARQNGATGATAGYFGNDRIAQSIEASGMRARSGGLPIFAGDSGTSEFKSDQRWYLTTFDHDED